MSKFLQRKNRKEQICTQKHTFKSDYKLISGTNFCKFSKNRVNTHFFAKLNKLLLCTNLFLWCLLLCGGVYGKDTPAPKYISLEQDLNQYYQYANGGWDGNWYVGYNSCWIIKLSAISTDGYSRVFIGAKLGRAKTTPNKDKPWTSVPLVGKIFMAISQNGGFDSQNTYLLVKNQDIPLETPQKEASLMMGQSQWFWTEIPKSKISHYKPNYFALWSGESNFTSAENSPIVAGANTNGDAFAWLNRSGKGAPPRDGTKALEIPLKGIAPAIAVKLVPKNNLKVEINNFRIKYKKDRILVSFNASGQDIYKVWVEFSYDEYNWGKLSSFVFNTPYTISFYKIDLPKDVFYIRAAACDALENTGYSDTIKVRRF